MDLNDTKVVHAVIEAIDKRVEKRLTGFKPAMWCAGKVAAGGSGATISVYLNDSATARDVRNPNGLTLSTGALVFIWLPNSKTDNMAFIDHRL